MLGAAIATFLLWPGAAPPAVGVRTDPTPITGSAGDLHLIAVLPVTALHSSADQVSLSASLAENLAAELSRDRTLVVTSRKAAPARLAKAVDSAQIAPYVQEAKQPPAPNLPVIAPAVSVEPSALPSPEKSFERNPYYAGLYRVEENKFPEVPCTLSRIASSAGGKCLRGYRGLRCDMAIDAVIYAVGNLSIEASTLIFDPYKLTATGFAARCYVAGYPEYDQRDFQDMNQVTRHGSNWHNLVSNGEDKSIEFSDGRHNCVAVHKAGPRWQGGYIYMMHASICRTDAAAMRAEDVAHALGLLQVRQDEPTGNWRQASD